ncbi:MAG: RibD family protein [Gemmatimonadaceae bacterium]|nr:RibD family protein [Gloeobacterales cyanobacterium ES-bin-141]
MTTLVLAMSLDGKIGGTGGQAAHFGSAADRRHLEMQVADADAVLMGADTVRAYSTAFLIRDPELIEARVAAGRPAQPLTIVCTRQADLSLDLPFFGQPLERVILTGKHSRSRAEHYRGVAEVWTCGEEEVDFRLAWEMLAQKNIGSLVALGGGNVAAQLFAHDLIDAVWLTVCPLVLGGKDSPTPVDGNGNLAGAPRLRLVSVERVADELFLHYRRERDA